MKKRIGVIGAGNMGEAIIKGIISAPCFLNCSHVVASDLSEERLKYIKKTYRVKTTRYNRIL